LFVYFFENNDFGWLICAYHFKRQDGWRAPQELIIGMPISQYTSYSAMFCPLHSNISEEQHEKYLCNPSSHNGKYGEYACEMAHSISQHAKAITPQFLQC